MLLSSCCHVFFFFFVHSLVCLFLEQSKWPMSVYINEKKMLKSAVTIISNRIARKKKTKGRKQKGNLSTVLLVEGPALGVAVSGDAADVVDCVLVIQETLDPECLLHGEGNAARGVVTLGLTLPGRQYILCHLACCE